MNEKNIPYNKVRPNKLYGGGGPRDMQRRQQGSSMGSANINMPQIDINALKEVLLNNKEAREELKAEIRREMENVREVVSNSKSIEGIGLPFEIVEQKIKDAVEQTERQTRERYESGLGSLNSQLNAAKSRIKELDNLLNEKRQEVIDLKELIVGKDETINTLREQQNHEVGDLKLKILDLIDKIKTGTINQDNYSDSARPILEDKIFIDPMGEVTTSLESHIDISASEAKGHKTDLKNDVAKLKDLLGKGTYKPLKAR
jgi:chromosome segregation ATPase